MAKDTLLVGLEVGTSKICVVVGEGRKDGTIHILGVSQSPSRGVRKGEIVDSGNAMQCIADTIVDAEKKSNVEIVSVWAGVTGAHIRSFNNSGTIFLPEGRNEICPEDIQDVETNAKEVNIPEENDFLHTINQQYNVDGQEGVVNPIDMFGQRLTGDFHIIHGTITRIQNMIRCIKEAHVEVEDIVFNPLASAEVVLTQEQKNLGVLVLDIGGGVTDFLVYSEGVIRHTGVLAVGGDHITNDISIGLRIPMTRAEKLKIEEGSAMMGTALPGEIISLRNDSEFHGRDIEREMLNTIIHVRVKELLEYVKREVQAEMSLDLLGGGVVITGGCSDLKGLRGLAEEVFQLPVTTSRLSPDDVSGPTSAFEDPRYSTAIGLVKYAYAAQNASDLPWYKRFFPWLR